MAIFEFEDDSTGDIGTRVDDSAVTAVADELNVTETVDGRVVLEKSEPVTDPCVLDMTTLVRDGDTQTVPLEVNDGTYKLKLLPDMVDELGVTTDDRLIIAMRAGKLVVGTF